MSKNVQSHNYIDFTCDQRNVQNSLSDALVVHESRSSRCSRGLRKGRGTRDQIDNVSCITENTR